MKHLIVACGIMKNELLQVQQEGDSFVFLQQCLHNTPEKLKAAVQEEINKDEARDGDTVIREDGLERVRSGSSKCLDKNMRMF